VSCRGEFFSKAKSSQATKNDGLRNTTGKTKKGWVRTPSPRIFRVYRKRITCGLLLCQRLELCGALQREVQKLFGFSGCCCSLRLDFERCDRHHLVASGAAEVFIHREERVWFEFSERLSQLLLNTVDLVEESAAVDFQSAAAEFPVRSKEKMKFEELVLPFGECPAADKAKVSDELLVLEPPNRFPLASGVRFERNAANVFLFRGTLLEARVAGAENSAKNAIARG
jgi:hypothetical protein